MDKPHNISGVFLLRIMVENYSGVDISSEIAVATAAARLELPSLNLALLRCPTTVHRPIESI